jgi:hypothetical protein
VRWVAAATRVRVRVAFVSLLLACAGPRPAEDAETVRVSGADSAGPQPSTSVRELPRTNVTATDRARWRGVLQWPAECENAFELTHISSDGGLFFRALEDGVTLIEVTCAAGAYQGSAVFVRLDENASPPAARTLMFATYTSADNETLERTESTELWGEAMFLQDARELTLLSVSRQTRDCGTWSRYSLAEAAPRLLELYAQIVCPEESGPPAQPEPGRPPDGWAKIPINREEYEHGQH